MDTEVYGADDEDSGFETSDSSDLESTPEAPTLVDEVRPLLLFRVRRENSTFEDVSGESNGWTNASHFLWSMCATLADGGKDPVWTGIFEKWRPQWKKIQKQVKTYGYTHFSSEIPPAPVDVAGVRLLGCLPKDFEIEQECPDEVSDRQDIWTLWRNIIEAPAGQIPEICVCLKDTERLLPSH